GWTATTPAVGGTGPVTETIGTLPAGSAPVVFTMIVNVNSNTTPGANAVNNTATIASPTDADGITGNNTATDHATVQTLADVGVTKTGPAGPILAGDNITYTITVNNTGPSDAQTVHLSDVVPTNTTFVSMAQ